MANPQATIRVKKKDGTFVSMTQEEFAAYKKKQVTQSASSATKPSGSTGSSRVSTTDSATPQPYVRVSAQLRRQRREKRRSRRKKSTQMRHKDTTKSVAASVPLSKESASPVKKKSPQSLQKNLSRSPVQKKKINVDTLADDLAKHTVVVPLKKDRPLAKSQRLAPRSKRALSRTTPVPHIFVDEAKASLAALPHRNIVKKKSDPSTKTPKKNALSGSIPLAAIPQAATADTWVPRHMEQKATSARKKKITDVQPPKPVDPPVKKYTTGPVDEIAQLSCTQLRQFVADPKEYPTFIIDKFTTLQKDSYLLYLEAIDAFHESPLWRVYQRVVSDSLNTKQSIRTLLTTGNPQYDGMTFDDFLSLTSVTMFLQV